MADGSTFDLGADVVELEACAPPAATTTALREVAFRADAWLPHELDRLRELFAADIAFEEIAADVGRGLTAVRWKAGELGLRRNSLRPWSEWEEAELQARYGSEPASVIAQDLGRGVTAVYQRASLLGLQDEGAAPYTAWEDAQIRTGYAIGVPVGQIAAMIGRPLAGVVSRASSALGLRHVNQPADWTAEEMSRALDLANEGHRYLKIIEMMVEAGFPRRTKNGFGQRLRILGYGRGWGRPYTEDEDDLIRKTYAEGGNLRDLASRLGRVSISWRCRTLGLQGTHPKPDGNRQGPPWTAEEDAKLLAGYGKGKVKYLAVEIGRPLMAVYNRAWSLGLKSDWCHDFTPDEDRAIGIAWRHGIGLMILADATGRQTRVLSGRAERLGFKFSDPERPVQPKGGGRRKPRLTLQEILALEPEQRPAAKRRLPADREIRRQILRPRALRAVRRQLRATR